MTDTAPESLHEMEQAEPSQPAEPTADHVCKDQTESRISTKSVREAGYIILFIGAVFITNAMETGSYRTPWPVAIITALAGLGVLGYSWYLQLRSPRK